MRRLGLLLAVVLGTSAICPVIASAHGGTVLASTPAGPFQVTLSAAPLLVPGRPDSIDYTAYVNDSATGEPVADARVRMAVGTGRVSHPRVQLIGGGYEAIMPADGARQRYLTTPVTVSVTSPLGRGLVDITPPGLPSSSAPSWLPAISVVIGLVLMGLVLRVRRGRAGMKSTAESVAVSETAAGRAPDADRAVDEASCPGASGNSEPPREQVS